jgi:DNA invertase Pin-like site-specific DNA recombinase
MSTPTRRRGLRDLRNLTGTEIRPYLRVSRADKADKATPDAERSTSTQRRIFTGWAAREGATAGPEYTDPDISASRFSARRGESDFDAMIRLRPDFARMVADIRAGALDGTGLWFWEIERQQRMLSVFAGLRDLCRDHGVFWVIRDKPADPASPDDMLFLGIKSILAEGESEKLSLRVYDGKESAAMKGRRAARIPYGYRRGPWNETREAFDPDVPDWGEHGTGPAAVVGEIYTRLGRGESLTSLRRDLNRRGIRTRPGKRHPDGAQWHNQSVRNLALNPAYAAMRVYQRGAHDSIAGAILDGVEADWPPLVDADTWWAVHDLLTAPSRLKHGGDTRPRHGGHLLSSIATCAVCGSKLIRRGPSRSAGTRRDSYVCRDHHCVGIDKELADEFTEQRIVAWLADPAVAAQIRAPESEAAQHAHREADAARRELEKWRRAAEAGRITLESFERAERGALERIGAAEARLAGAAPRTLAASLGPQAQAGWDSLDVTARRRIVAEVAHITVHPVGRGHGAGPGPVHPAYRIGWRWLLTPGTYHAPLNWEEHRDEARRLNAQTRQRRDYVSEQRRRALTEIITADPMLPDRQVAIKAGRIDRHAIRRIRRELEEAGQIPRITHTRWQVTNHGYLSQAPAGPGSPSEASRGAEDTRHGGPPTAAGASPLGRRG